MNKIRALLTKHKDILPYLFFGVLTSLVDYAVYLPLHNLLDLSAAVSNIIAWAVAVIFAFLTNKRFVFKSNDWSIRTLMPEFWTFTLCRVCSGLMETAFLFVMADLLAFDGNIMKLLISVVVVTLNYISSKLIVFKK